MRAEGASFISAGSAVAVVGDGLAPLPILVRTAVIAASCSLLHLERFCRMAGIFTGCGFWVTGAEILSSLSAPVKGIPYLKMELDPIGSTGFDAALAAANVDPMGLDFCEMVDLGFPVDPFGSLVTGGVFCGVWLVSLVLDVGVCTVSSPAMVVS